MKKTNLLALLTLVCLAVTSCGKSGDIDLKYTIDVTKYDDDKSLKFSDTEYDRSGPDISLNSKGTTLCRLGLVEEDGKISQVYFQVNVHAATRHKEIKAMTIALHVKGSSFSLSMAANANSLSDFNEKLINIADKGDGLTSNIIFETVPASQEELDNPEVQKILKEIQEGKSSDIEFYVVAGAVLYNDKGDSEIE